MKQTTFEDISPEYAEFIEKFKPKKTTDDCYTPENVYDVAADWAARKYGFDRSAIVRPFWPGADFERAEYPDGCVVVDNPPFSILSKICQFYNSRGVRFFLFAPALTPFCSGADTNTIICGASVTYANGAVVNTSFVTNMGEWLVETAPDLHDAIKAADAENRAKTTKQLPKYQYPDAVIHAARLNWLAVHHTEFRVRKEDAVFIRKLDAQGSTGIFGGGFLLSERAAAERAAAERAAAERAAAERAAVHKWQLSEREKALQKLIGRNAK